VKRRILSSSSGKYIIIFIFFHDTLTTQKVLELQAFHVLALKRGFKQSIGIYGRNVTLNGKVDGLQVLSSSDLYRLMSIAHSNFSIRREVKYVLLRIYVAAKRRNGLWYTDTCIFDRNPFEETRKIKYFPEMH